MLDRGWGLGGVGDPRPGPAQPRASGDLDRPAAAGYPGDAQRHGLRPRFRPRARHQVRCLPDFSSAVGGPAQALELAPETLAGPAPSTHGHDRWPGIRHDGRAVVHVAGRGDGGSHTRLDRPHDLDDALATRDESLHPIAWANLRRRLRRRSVHEDVGALAQPRRQRAGLHKAHRAQPAIDTRLVGSEGISHAF